jgi:hypothetical protein
MRALQVKRSNRYGALAWVIAALHVTSLVHEVMPKARPDAIVLVGPTLMTSMQIGLTRLRLQSKASVQKTHIRAPAGCNASGQASDTETD